MAKKKKDTVEFRFYEIPQGDAALVLCGESWIRVYGHEEFHLHFHNLMEIGICRYGAGNLHLNEDVYRYRDGMITMIPENYPHVTISDGEDVNYWEYIFIDPKRIVEKLFPNNPVYQKEIIDALNRAPMITEGDEILTQFIERVMEETKSKQPFHRKMIEEYVSMLILELMRREKHLMVEAETKVKGSNMAQIAAALDFVNKNFEQSIRVKELADICSMSETHFRRIFEAYINMSPMDYVNLIRIQKACELMKKTNDSMDLVASKCGFTTTSTFNRNFKKFLETSPYQWKINPKNYESKLLNFRITALKGW